MTDLKQLVYYTLEDQADGNRLVNFYLTDKTKLLGSIQVAKSFPLEDINLLQFLVTPHAHIALLDAIIPLIEDLESKTEGSFQQSIKNWLIQAKGLILAPETPVDQT
jgi:hypothetical protein